MVDGKLEGVGAVLFQWKKDVDFFVAAFRRNDCSQDAVVLI